MPQKDSTSQMPKPKSVPEFCTSEAGSSASCNSTSDSITSSTSSTSSTQLNTITPVSGINTKIRFSRKSKNHYLYTFQKKLTLEEENRQLKDARLCKVCMDDDVAVVFLPCGHLGNCDSFQFSYLHEISQIN